MRMYSVARIGKGVRSLLFGPTALRRRTLLEVTRIMAGVLGGHYIGDDYKLWLKERAFVDKFKSLSPHNFFSMERKFCVKELARSVRDLPGAVAECGSYVGVAAWFIANELPDAEFYLFDSFEGLSDPTGKDVVSAGVQQWKKGDLAVTEQELHANLHEFSKIHVMKGWIPDRFLEVAHEQFKFVHVDVDLYQPTLESLSFFYDRLVSGGVIVMDDYGFENCPGAYAAANEFMADKSETIIHLPTGQGVIIKR